MIHKHKGSDGSYLLVQVPEDAHGLSIEKDFSGKKALYWSSEEAPFKTFGMDAVYLPEANWEILCKASEVTEEQAKGMVINEWAYGINKYKDYAIKMTVSLGFAFFPTAIESFQSLLTSLDMKAETTLILKEA